MRYGSRLCCRSPSLLHREQLGGGREAAEHGDVRERRGHGARLAAELDVAGFAAVSRSEANARLSESSA